MQVIEKINLSNRANQITLINEGLFIRCYNQSAFIVTELLRLPFKLTYWQVKKLPDTPIVYCGFPASKIADYFSNLKPTAFGFEVVGTFNLTYYDAWLKQQIEAAERCGKKARARSAGAKNHGAY